MPSHRSLHSGLLSTGITGLVCPEYSPFVNKYYVLLKSYGLSDYESIKDKLPEKYFNPTQTKEFVESINKSCDWKNRKGKFVDFFTMKNIGGTDQTAFIYEYFLDCDSIRVVLIYNMLKESPELFKINLEPIEKENKMIIDPSKQLLAK